MLAPRLAARLTLIVFIAFLIIWMGMVVLFYFGHEREREDLYLAPAKVLAIVELVEQAPSGERSLVLQAVGTSLRDVSIRRSGLSEALPAGARQVSENLRKLYAEALGRRAFFVVAQPVSDTQQRFPRIFGTATNALRFGIALESGETLVINVKNSMLVSRLGLPVGFVAGLFGTLVALLALIFMHRETRPLVRLASAVDRMDLSGPPELLPEERTGTPEIRALITSFNRLQSRLSQLLRARMIMIGGISHDVRTFATRLRLRVDHIAEGAERERAISDISDMIRLLDDALLASRAGAGELAEELVEFDELVGAEVEDRRAAGAAIEIRIAASVRGATVLGDRLALRRIVFNLTDNALRYGCAAHVRLDADADAVTLIVDDEGTGIPEELRELLLEPFVRLETSRNRRTGGAGLGLAIVRNLVEAHGGVIAIGHAPSGGARFSVRLPVFRPMEQDGSAAS